MARFKSRVKWRKLKKPGQWYVARIGSERVELVRLKPTRQYRCDVGERRMMRPSKPMTLTKAKKWCESLARGD